MSRDELTARPSKRNAPVTLTYLARVAVQTAVALVDSHPDHFLVKHLQPQPVFTEQVRPSTPHLSPRMSLLMASETSLSLQHSDLDSDDCRSQVAVR